TTRVPVLIEVERPVGRWGVMKFASTSIESMVRSVSVTPPRDFRTAHLDGMAHGPGWVYDESMNRSAYPILIGCSGCSYAAWEVVFYHEGMVAGEFLEFYADRFPIVEVDSTFYRPPTPRMVRGWRDRTPDDFQFSLKVPQVITHEKQL